MSSRPPDTPSLRAAVAQVIAALEQPVARAELVSRVLALHPSRAGRPADLVMAEVRRHTDLVRLEDGRYATPDWVLRGVRFRHVPTPVDAANGIVPIFPCFVPFLLERDTLAGSGAGGQKPTLVDDATGAEIAYEMLDLHGSLLTDGPGDNAIHFQALNLRPWFRQNNFAVGDSLLLTLEEPRRAVFRLSCEAAADTDRAAVAIQDATLEAVLVGLVERSTSEQPFIEEIIPAALARLHEAARRYPGNHWHTVVTRSPRLRAVDDYAVARATFRRPIDRLLGYTGSAASEKELMARVEVYNADQARILEVTMQEGADAPHTALSGPDIALRRSMRQIAAFLRHEGGGPSLERLRSLAAPAVYLAKHEGASLAEADFPMLCRFLLSYYPRRVLFNRKAFTARMLGALRRFFEVQSADRPEAGALPAKISRLHGLVDRKIALLAEVDLTSPASGRLFTRLFPDADKEDAEVITLALREAPPTA
jgi:hypothetical protein